MLAEVVIFLELLKDGESFVSIFVVFVFQENELAENIVIVVSWFNHRLVLMAENTTT